MEKKNFAWWMNEGFIKFIQDDFDNAIVAFENAIEIYPDLIDPYIMVAKVIREFGHDDEALDYLLKNQIQEKLRKSGKLSMFLSYGGLWEKYNKYSSERTFWCQLGSLHVINGEHGGAINAFSSYLKKKPKDQTFWMYLVYAYMDDCKIEEAIKICNDALEVNPKFRGIKFFLAYIYKNFVKEVKYDKVIEICQNVLKTDSTFTEMHFFLSTIYLSLKQNDKALKAINDALNFNPNYYDAMEFKGVILARKKEYSNVVQLFKFVSHREPLIYFHWYNLALAYLKTGRYDDGLNACYKCLKLNSEFKYCLQLKSMLNKCKSSKTHMDQDFREVFYRVNMLRKMLEKFY